MTYEQVRRAALTFHYLCKDMHFVDIHTHRRTAVPGTESVYVRLLDGCPPVPFPGRYWAGIHPWDADRAEESWLEPLRRHDPCRLGIGEIGLDFRRKGVSAEKQEYFFTVQLGIAVRQCVPVIIHCVGAHDAVLNTLKKYRPELPAVIIHGFIGSEELARRYIKAGCMLSFGFGAIESPKTIHSLKSVPLSALFLESDEDQRDISVLYQFVAGMLSMETAALEELIFQNYMTILNAHEQ